MTRSQINFLITVHRSQMDYAKAYLDQHYYDLEADGKEEEWLKRYIYHKRAIEELQQQKPDD